jgi:hypothetical protein
MTGTETSLEPAAKPRTVEILAPLDIDWLAETFKKFEEFKQRILNHDDWMEIQGRKFYKKSAWRKWELACGVSDEIIEQQRVPATGEDPDRGFYWRIVTRAFHLGTGRSSVGVAIASSTERDKWSHLEHDVYTLAATRSKNRAISDLVGGGEVSAEEVSQEAEAPKSNTAASTWHVTTDAAPEQIRQEPIFHKTATVGTVSIDDQHGEYAFVPEAELRADAAPISNFLDKKILATMRDKHRDSFDYAIDAVDGRLRSVLVRGPLDPDRLKELMDAVGWAFAKAAETKTTGGGK